MKTLLSFILVIISYSFTAATTPLVKYVWAPNGLNIRQFPSTKAPVLAVLNYGDAVTQLAATDKTFYSKFVASLHNEDESILLKNTWVKIIKEGVEGFVVDSYLLDFVAPRAPYFNEYYTTLKNTYDAKNILIFEPNLPVEYLLAVELPNDKSIRISEGAYNQNDFYFQNFTHQEILVFLNKFLTLDDKNTGGFDLNWAEKITLYVDNLSVFIKDLENGITTVEVYYEGC